jgi:hypothetical protein
MTVAEGWMAMSERGDLFHHLFACAVAFVVELVMPSPCVELVVSRNKGAMAGGVCSTPPASTAETQQDC